METTGFAHHMYPRGMNKSVGLVEALKWLDIEPSQVAAFGDSDNDVQMLEGCGYNVAPANSTPRARKAAGYVASKPYGEGVVEGLEKLGLI